MTTLRRALWGIHIALLVFVSYVAMAAAVQAPEKWSQIATGASVVAIALAYGFTLYRRGFSRLAPFLFLLSCALAVSFVDGGVRAAARHTAGLGTVAQILLTMGLTGAAWYWMDRRSKRVS